MLLELVFCDLELSDYSLDYFSSLLKPLHWQPDTLVSQLLAHPPDATERAHARAAKLLERWGVLSRDAMALEALTGGFSAVYPVLKAMEEAGKIRRGHFVAEFSGAQFAFVGAVDQLRAARQTGDEPGVRVLAATDPANPWGALLPWPDPTCAAARPRRAAGATIALVDGAPRLYVDAGAHRAWSFAGGEGEDVLLPAARALGRRLAATRTRAVVLERSDDVAAADSLLAEVFLKAGFRRGYKGLEYDRPAGDAG